MINLTLTCDSLTGFQFKALSSKFVHNQFPLLPRQGRGSDTKADSVRQEFWNRKKGVGGWAWSYNGKVLNFLRPCQFNYIQFYF